MSAGTKLIAFNFMIFATLRPVIIVKTPPQALKSAIIVALKYGEMTWAKKKQHIKMIN